MKKLPDRPSELLALALMDLEKAEESPDHIVYMDVWMGLYQEKCYVCLAGSVLAFSQHIKPEKLHEINGELHGSSRCLRGLDEDTFNKLDALDTMRLGYLNQALDRMGVHLAKPVQEVAIIPYDMNKEEFKKCMRRQIDILKRSNL